MVDAVAEDVVQLDGVRCRAVDERRGAHRRLAAEQQPRCTVIELLGERGFQRGGRRHDRARQRGRHAVDDRALGVVYYLVSERRIAHALDELTTALDDEHALSALP